MFVTTASDISMSVNQCQSYRQVVITTTVAITAVRPTTVNNNSRNNNNNNINIDYDNNNNIKRRGAADVHAVRTY